MKEALWEKNVPANVYVGMRYWHPFTEEAIEQVLHYNFEVSVLFLALQAYKWFSYCLNLQHPDQKKPLVTATLEETCRSKILKSKYNLFILQSFSV